jgi:transcriptional regulator with XRE-family HTH domain
MMDQQERCPEAFRRWLKDQFEQRGWSHSDVAREAGDMTVSTIGRILDGGEHPGWDFIASMAKLLDKDLRFVAWKAGRWDSLPEGSPLERDLLETFEQLTPEHRELALLMIHALVARQKRRGKATPDRLTSTEIRRLDAGRFTLGNPALGHAVSQALAKVPADVVEELMDRCVILMPESADRSAFLPADLVRDKDVIPVSDDLLDLDESEAEDEILRKVAHYRLGHRGSLSHTQLHEAAGLVDRWRSGTAQPPLSQDWEADPSREDPGAGGAAESAIRPRTRRTTPY